MLVAERVVLRVDFNIVSTSYLPGGPATPSELGVGLDLVYLYYWLYPKSVDSMPKGRVSVIDL
jgi:hypothetical protein